VSKKTVLLLFLMPMNVLNFADRFLVQAIAVDIVVDL